MTKLLLGVAAISGLSLLGAAGYGASIVWRPPAPLALGTLLWDYETGFTVARVTRRPLPGSHTAYDVTVRVFCPFGERYRWTPRSAHVIDNTGRSYYAVAATRAHTILGASDTEHMTFALTDSIEQPALVFDEAFGFGAIVDELRAGRIYEPHRFNLRYD